MRLLQGDAIPQQDDSRTARPQCMAPHPAVMSMCHRGCDAVGRDHPGPTRLRSWKSVAKRAPVAPRCFAENRTRRGSGKVAQAARTQGERPSQSAGALRLPAWIGRAKPASGRTRGSPSCPLPPREEDMSLADVFHIVWLFLHGAACREFTFETMRLPGFHEQATSRPPWHDERVGLQRLVAQAGSLSIGVDKDVMRRALRDGRPAVFSD